ncbi:hypothetical protein [Streptomyces sp. NPDC002763]
MLTNNNEMTGYGEQQPVAKAIAETCAGALARRETRGRAARMRMLGAI